MIQTNQKRLCLFAGYNYSNTISQYVINYLQELSQYADIYYCSEGELSSQMIKQLEQTVKKAYGVKHKKYDFGSWAELIKIIGWRKIEEYDELLLVNDSCLGGVFSLKPMFDEMYSQKIQAWAAAGNHFMMSFFVCITKDIFATDEFKSFFNNIKEEDNKSIVIKKYERGLDTILQKYQTGVFLSPIKLKNFCRHNQKLINEKIKAVVPFCLRFFFRLKNNKINFYDENALLPILMEFPLVKKNAFKNKSSLFSVYAAKFITQNSNYSQEIINNMLQTEKIKSLGIFKIICYKILLTLRRFVYEEKYKKDLYIIRIFKIPVYRKNKNYSI